jgi:hypothetical protein
MLMKMGAQLLRHFEVTIANPTKPWRAVNAMGFIHKDFFVRLVPREGKT